MVSPEQCFKEDMLIGIVRINQLLEVELLRLIEGGYYLRILIANHPNYLYVSTIRNEKEPRHFQTMDAAVSVAMRLFGDECKFVVRNQK